MSIDLKPVDAVVFYGMCTFFVLLGLSHGVYNYCESQVKKTVLDFLTASTHHGKIKSSLSILANTLSAWILVRLPVSVYYTGPQIWISILNLGLAVSFANFVVVPVFMRLHVTTAMAYLEKRFGNIILTISLVSQAVESLLMMALWLAVPIQVLSDLSGLSFYATLIATAFLVTLVSSLGGMRAIQVIDIIHLSVISIGNLLIFTKGTVVSGGFTRVLEVNAYNERTYFEEDINPFTRKSTSWLILLTYLSFGILNYSFNQAIIDKYIPSTTIKDARYILWIQIPLMSLFYAIAIFLGLNMYAFYLGCDPVLTKRASSPEDILSTYVQDVAGQIPGLVGIFSVTLISGALSVTAANLNGLSSIVNEHFIRRNEHLYDLLEHKWHLMGFLTFFISIVFLPLVILVIIYDKTVQGLITNPVSILNVIKAPIFGVYLLGFFNRRSTSKGALTGLVVGIIVGIALLYANYLNSSPNPPPAGATVTECPEAYCLAKQGFNDSKCFTDTSLANLTSITIDKDLETSSAILNYNLGGVLTTIITFILGSLVSFCTHQTGQEREENVKYLIPALHHHYSKKKV